MTFIFDSVAKSIKTILDVIFSFLFSKSGK